MMGRIDIPKVNKATAKLLINGVEYLKLSSVEARESITQRGWLVLRETKIEGIASEDDFMELIRLSRDKFVTLKADVIIMNGYKQFLFQRGLILSKIEFSQNGEFVVRLTVKDTLSFMTDGEFINQGGKNYTVRSLIQNILKFSNCDYKVENNGINDIKIDKTLGLKNTNMEARFVDDILSSICNAYKLAISSNGFDTLYISKRNTTDGIYGEFSQWVENGKSHSDFISFNDVTEKTNIPSKLVFLNIAKTKGKKGNVKNIAYEHHIDGGEPHRIVTKNVQGTQNLETVKNSAKNYVAGMFAANNRFNFSVPSIFSLSGGLFQIDQRIRLQYNSLGVDEIMVILDLIMEINPSSMKLSMQVASMPDVEDAGNIQAKKIKTRLNKKSVI